MGGAEELDGLLDRLEALMARLADPAAPLERLVVDYEEASRLLRSAEAALATARSRMATAVPASGGDA